jgi:hypothetical protein
MWAILVGITRHLSQVTANLKIMGGDADVDNFLKATRNNVQDLEAAVVELKAKALRQKFEEMFIYGDTGVSAKQFDGLRKLINTGEASDQVIAMGSTGATLTLDKLDELIDAVKGGKPDLLLMSRRSRRKISSLIRDAGGMIETNQDRWGNFVQLWDGVPLGVNDWILDTHVLADGEETATTGGACSTIYAVQLGEGALCGLTSPGYLQAEPIGSLETKDATGRGSNGTSRWRCSAPSRRRRSSASRTKNRIRKNRAGPRARLGAPRKEKEMEKKESARWQCRFRLSKYREDIGAYRGDEARFHRRHRPYEVIEKEGNLLLNSGIDEMWDLITGDSSNHFDSTYARIGVGDSSTAAGASQTDLQAATNKTYKGMESGYPASTSQQATFKASFGESEANYAWNEWVVKQSASGKCLNRKVESLGTKTSGTWTLEVTVTLA